MFPVLVSPNRSPCTLPACFSQELRKIALLLRTLSAQVEGISDPYERALRMDQLKESTLQVDEWAEAMGQASGESRKGFGRLRHSSTQLLEAIRTSSLLRGGGSKLKLVVQRAISLVAPASVSGPLCSGLEPSEDRKHFARSSLPSESTMARGELSLDIALSLSRRRTFDPGVLRYIWTDSSPLAGFDLLWAQSHEIHKNAAVRVCQSSHKLIANI